MPTVPTLLFTDIVGSTRHAVELGDAAWRDALEYHDRLVRDEVAIAGGRVVKNLGDGYLVSFEDADSALECAQALVAAARTMGFEIRAGLHTGTVQSIGDDLAGITVHIAARVRDLAEPGRVIGTGAVANAARGAIATLVDRGCRELRDVPGRFRLFEAVGREAHEDAGSGVWSLTPQMT
jgi:class 3 adenylate cyclase